MRNIRCFTSLIASDKLFHLIQVFQLKYNDFFSLHFCDNLSSVELVQFVQNIFKTGVIGNFKKADPIIQSDLKMNHGAMETHR
jgi:hypothetical protein